MKRFVAIFLFEKPELLTSADIAIATKKRPMRDCFNYITYKLRDNLYCK